VISRTAFAATSRALAFVALPVCVLDVVTKRLAVAYLQPPHTAHRVLGDAVRFTLGYNQQGVMGLPVGPYSRWILSGVSIVLVAVLVRLLYESQPHEKLRATSLAVIIGGALGNLLDRLASGRGVVDFIDIGSRTWRFWTFNVADMAIDIGIAVFAWTLWRAARHAPSAGSRGEGGT
jgi:signal peptidase II